MCRINSSDFSSLTKTKTQKPIEEIADVDVMIRQLRLIFGDECMMRLLITKSNDWMSDYKNRTTW